MVGKKLSFLFLSVLLVVLVGCTKKDQNIKIGVTQFVSHAALDSSREGFIDALASKGFNEENVTFMFSNAQGDVSTTSLIASDLVSKKVDMIMAIATPSAQSVKNASENSDIPVLFSAVTDPVAAGLVESFENKEGNVTGTSDMAPIEKQFELIKTLLPNVKTVGIVYSLGEANSESQLKLAKSEADKLGLTLKTKGVTSATELSDSLDALLTEIDALYIPTDNLVASSMAIVVEKSIQKKIPVIGSEESQVENGALITEGIDYYNLGYQTGLMAAAILEGKEPNQIPVETLNETKLVINMDTANKLGITIPEDLLSLATLIEETHDN